MSRRNYIINEALMFLRHKDSLFSSAQFKKITQRLVRLLCEDAMLFIVFHLVTNENYIKNILLYRGNWELFFQCR